jgi:hypothetical protein
MKVRNGFVSNSSSSSFILGYGVIKDEVKLKKYLEENNIKLDGYNVRILKPNLEKINSLECCNNATLYIPNELLNNDLFLVEIANNEGDEGFYKTEEFNDDCYELDYSIAENIDFYSREQQKLIEVFDNKDLIIKGEVIFGAERNG